MPASPRYLVSFDARRILHQFADAVVVGAGIAGLRAALEFPPELTVAVLTKDQIRESNSAYAQGGIAGVLSPEDNFENHIDDTHVAGAGLCHPAVVEMVIREAPAQIGDLVRFGTEFDLALDGQLALTREGGHSHRRIVHALGDATGAEVMRAMIARARRQENVVLRDGVFTLDLLTHEGRVAGVLAWSEKLGVHCVWAKHVILASGGSGVVYRETTNPPVATGDGMAAAWRAGAALRDMEFMQFHPTVLYVAGSARSLISEAVRGEGAFLRDVNGERFMLGEDPRAELAPRDIVARAIFRTMEKTQHPNVYLDLSHIDPVTVRTRFPGIGKVCRSFGLDITRDKIPVRPGAHYMIGGVVTDMGGRAGLPGLWAAGEVTSTGLHGANRLASNSLIEGLVYGTLCARGAADEIARDPSPQAMVPIKHRREAEPGDELDVSDLTNSLRSLMVRQMGIVRTRKRLDEARRDVEFWCRYVLAHEFDGRAGWELQNLLTVARLMILSAAEREESRGTHFRADFPDSLDGWKRHVEAPARAEV